MILSVAALGVLVLGCERNGGGRESADGRGERADGAQNTSRANRRDGAVVSPSDASPGSPSAFATGSPETASSAPSGGASSDDTAVTKAGTRLKMGESAVAGLTSGDRRGLVRITPIGVEKGSIQDLVQGGYSLTKEQHRATPYYVRVSYINLSDSDLSLAAPASHLGGLADHTQRVSPTVLLEGLEKCPASDFTSFTKGTVRTDCRTFLLPAAASFDGVVYRLPDSTSPPIEWRR